MSDKFAASVVTLLGFNGSDGDTTIVEESGASRTWTAVGNAQLDTSNFKYGSAALLCDGVGDYVTTANSADFAFGTGDLTVEFWLYPTSGALSGTPGTFNVGVNGTNGTLSCGLNAGKPFCGASNVSFGVTNPASLTANQWVHIAHCRASGTLRNFVNGVLVASGADSFNYPQGIATVGASLNPADGTYIGFINAAFDEVRVTKGVARYLADFTPPRGAFDRNRNVGNSANRASPVIVNR